MGTAFSAQMSGQIPGWPAATRVMSRKPPAARRSSAPSCSAPALAAFISVAATRWGTWETTATSRSWSAAESTRTSAPRLSTTPLRRSKTSRSVTAVGVSTQTAPSKRSGSAPCSPICSEPAIGCPPMKRGWSAASTMAVLTPLTSVTTASGRRPVVAEEPAHLAGDRGGRHGDEDHLGVEVVPGRVDHARRPAPRAAAPRRRRPGDVPARAGAARGRSSPR